MDQERVMLNFRLTRRDARRFRAKLAEREQSMQSFLEAKALEYLGQDASDIQQATP